MNFLIFASRVATLLILIFLITIWSSLETLKSKERHFYELKDKKINLFEVKEIAPRLEYIITTKETEQKEIFKRVTLPLNAESIQRVEELLSQAMQSEFYNIELAASMLFDRESVELFHSERYLRRASSFSVDESMLQRLHSYGLDDFQYKNLSKLKDKVYEDKESFLEEVISYAKLKKGEWLESEIPLLGLDARGAHFMKNLEADAPNNTLTQESIKSIVAELEKAYSEYKSIY